MKPAAWWSSPAIPYVIGKYRYEGRLPPNAYGRTLAYFPVKPYWHQVITPYMGKHNPGPDYPWSFGW